MTSLNVIGSCFSFFPVKCIYSFAKVPCSPQPKQLNAQSCYANKLLDINSMPKRTSINDVKEIEQLNDLNQIVNDKRNNKRSEAKKERRNRHYVKVLIKSQLKESLNYE